MQIIKGQTFDEERALYGRSGIEVIDCRFDGPADGESAFKECRNVIARGCFYNLRYPFWHDKGLVIEGGQMTDKCRAALWYSERVKLSGLKMHGIKAVRECTDVEIRNCDIISPEFGWSARGLVMEDTTAQSEYFMMRSSGLRFKNVDFTGKYSFQYIEDAVFESCSFDTKDAFWHGKNILVKNCRIKGEYLAWYAENITFENCVITGTQPLCYDKGIKLIGCEMIDTDLCFERSEVTATLTAPVVSIKNPLKGTIRVPSVGEIIMDIPEAQGRVITD